jgi:hypothetical protein
MSAPAPASRVLVVAGSAAESDELLEALVERSRSQPVELTLIVPASIEAVGLSAERDVAARAARRRLRAALARFRAAGLYVREAGVGEGGPVLAVADAVAAGQVDEIVVATPLRRLRRRPRLGERLGAATGLPVTHVLGRAGRDRDPEQAPARPARRSREERHGARPAQRRPPERERPSAAWARSREPELPLSGMAVVRLNLARGFALMGFVLLSLAVAGATNA